MKIFGFSGQLNSGNLIFLGSYADFASNELSGRAGAIGKIAKEPEELPKGAICLGDFDGVHLGHRRLFEIAREYSYWGVLVFDRSFKNAGLLTTLSEKLDIINALGADYAVICQLSEEVINSSPEEFADFLKNKLNAMAVVCGYDYRFGKAAAGDAELMEKLCKIRNIKTEIAEAVKYGEQPVKSTHIRELVASGELLCAAELLGRYYSVTASVKKGLQNGRKMGFPTANIEIVPEKILPPDGVYYGRVSGRAAVINIGKNLTFDAKIRTMEAHIPDFSGDMYGSVVTAELIEKIRDVIKFDSINELKKQISDDIEYIKRRK